MKEKTFLGENSENDCSVRQSFERLLVMARDANSSIDPSVVYLGGVWD